jgi:flagellar basal body P-ring formation protein FlgA
MQALRFFLLVFFGFFFLCARADELSETISQFIHQQTANLSGEVSFTIGNVDGQKRLPACKGFQAFFPNGNQQLGNTTVGVRCLLPSTWTIYVPVKITVIGTYILSSHGLSAGQVITSSDIQEGTGDIGTLPNGVLLKADQAIGKSARFAIAAGQPLRSEQLIAQVLIRQNQSVRLVVEGPGFKAGAEGKALNNASEGQVVQVRIPSGSTVSGIAQSDGSVSVSYSK